MHFFILCIRLPITKNIYYAIIISPLQESERLIATVVILSFAICDHKRSYGLQKMVLCMPYIFFLDFFGQ